MLPSIFYLSRSRSQSATKRQTMHQTHSLKPRGVGLHHVALRAVDFDASLRFYTAGLGFQPTLQFEEDGVTVALLDTGNGTYIELFGGGTGTQAEGAIFHFALHTDDCAVAVERARGAGARIIVEPTDAELVGDTVVPVRYAFCAGPDGEQIEFLQSAYL